ncbi:MAG TPA: CBS domain-containing protein [Anaeromyxobacter sp.]|nr:CBS domain-containing protein [Anaeromyxobacter sp.]
MACIGSRVVREVVALDRSASCAEAAREMAAAGVGSIGVTVGGTLVGLVTERDIVRHLAAGNDTFAAPLGAVLRPDQPAVSPCATDRECAELMRAHRTRHLLVKDGEQIVGVVSMLDLVDVVVEEKEWRIDQLESYIGGGRCQQLSAPVCSMFRRRAEAA